MWNCTSAKRGEVSGDEPLDPNENGNSQVPQGYRMSIYKEKPYCNTKALNPKRKAQEAKRRNAKKRKDTEPKSLQEQ